MAAEGNGQCPNRMTPERWQRIREIFDGAAECDEPVRPEFIRQHCGSDQELQREVESLLAFDCKAASVLENPVAEAAAAVAARMENLPAAENETLLISTTRFAVLKDRYEVLRELGRGGMSVVYLARDRELMDKSVVVKVLLEETGHDPWMRQKFMQEMEALARIDHPGVVGVLDTGLTAEGNRFLVMQFIEGVNLRSVIGPGGMDFTRAAGIIRQIGQALSAAHEKGVWHRDLKPENVMLQSLGGEDHVKLIDFGIAGIQNSQFTGEKTKVSGSLSYMAPEQFAGQSCAASDTYSLGMLAYKMLTGTLPGPATHEAESQGPNLEFPANLPEAARRAITRALSLRADLRHAGVREFSEELYQVLTNSGSMTAASSPTPTPRTFRKAWIAGAVTALVLIGSTAWWFARGRPGMGPAGDEVSIAVLPFKDMSQEKNQAYFSEGLAEELLDELARVPGLRVAASRSSFTFKDGSGDFRTIGNKLRVANLLQGSVRKQGNRARIGVQLIKTKDGFELWSDTFERDLADIFVVQQDIAHAVTEKLQLTVMRGKNAPAVARSTSAAAHDHYLQGRFFESRRNRDGLEKAATHYEQAVELDPGYAPAWAGLGQVRMNRAIRSYTPREEGFRKAREALDRAVRLNPNLGEGYAGLAGIAMYHDWNWDTASAAAKKALTLDPRNARIINVGAVLAMNLGRFEEAIALDRLATGIDPLSSSPYHNAGRALYNAGRYAEADVALRKALELEPDRAGTHLLLSLIHLAQGRGREALEEAELVKDQDDRLFSFALAHVALGNKAEADANLAKLIATSADDDPCQIAEVYAYRGENDRAFQWLDRAYAQRDSALPEIKGDIKGDPRLRMLEQDPRYAALLRKIGLPW